MKTKLPYTPVNLVISLINSSSKSVFKKLKYFLGFIILYAIAIIILDKKFDIIPKNSSLGQFHLLFSFCLTIIISFRINVAYNRWWEARSLWGSLMNNTRNLSMKLNKYIGFNNDNKLNNYIAFFPILLKFYLKKDIQKCLQLLKEDLNIHSDENINPPVLLIQKIINKIDYYRATNQITLEQFLALDKHIAEFSDILGGCEKILNTIPPPGFSTFIKFALLFYILIFPFGWVNSFQLLIVPIITIFIYILMGLEVLAEEIETPFGVEYNSLPIDIYAENIKNNALQAANMPRD